MAVRAWSVLDELNRFFPALLVFGIILVAWLSNKSEPKTSLGDKKNRSEIWKNWAQVIAIAIAGIWALYTYSKARAAPPIVSHELLSTVLPDGSTVVSVAVKIHNPGNTRLDVELRALNLRELSAPRDQAAKWPSGGFEFNDYRCIFPTIIAPQAARPSTGSEREADGNCTGELIELNGEPLHSATLDPGGEVTWHVHGRIVPACVSDVAIHTVVGKPDDDRTWETVTVYPLIDTQNAATTSAVWSRDGATAAHVAVTVENTGTQDLWIERGCVRLLDPKTPRRSQPRLAEQVSSCYQSQKKRAMDEVCFDHFDYTFNKNEPPRLYPRTLHIAAKSKRELWFRVECDVENQTGPACEPALLDTAMLDGYLDVRGGSDIEFQHLLKSETCSAPVPAGNCLAEPDEG